MSGSDESRPSFISKQVIAGRYAFVDLIPGRDVPFSIVCAGREECSAEYDMNRAGFQYYALEYIASGHWEMSTDKGHWQVGGGTVFAYDPMTSYRLRAVGKTNLIKFFVDFSGSDSRSRLKRAQIPLGVPVRLANTHWIRDIFDQILSLDHAQRPFGQEAGTLLTDLLLMRVREDRAGMADSTPAAQAAYERCQRLIRREYTRLRRADEIAAACHLDPAYMSRLFKRFAGETPYHFLTRLKINHAAGLLVHERLTVKEVASRVGYDDPYHFSRVFKKQQGLSPLRFVEAMQRSA